MLSILLMLLLGDAKRLTEAAYTALVLAARQDLTELA